MVTGGSLLDLQAKDTYVDKAKAFYVDQAGAAWTMCVDAQGASVTRYTLQDSTGQPLPEAAKDAADVAWKPGARLTAA